MFEDGCQGEHFRQENLRARDSTPREPLQTYEEPPTKNMGGRGVKKNPPKIRRQWSNQALMVVIDALDDGYKMQDVSNKFDIPRST